MPSLSDLRARYAGKPYELTLDDGTTLSIAPPENLGKIMDLEASTAGNILEILVALAGDQGEQLREVLRELPLGALPGVRDEAYSLWGTGKSSS